MKRKSFEKSARFEISGVAHKSLLSRLQITLDGKPGKIRWHLIQPPIFGFTRKADPFRPFQQRSLRNYCRNVIIKLSRNPGLLFPNHYVGISIEFNPSDLNLSVSKELVAHIDGSEIEIYISRDVSRHGIASNRLDLTWDYVLDRKWDQFRLLIINAKYSDSLISLPSRDAPLPSTSDSGVKPQVNSWIGSTFFQLVCSEPPYELTSSDFYSWTSIESQNIQRGPFPIRLDDDLGPQWSMAELSDARVHHGQVIIADDQLWLTDASKVPAFGHLSNVWPGVMYGDAKEAIHSPKPVIFYPDVESAFFLGGTNNWMHFVIEDISKIKHFEKVDPLHQVPLLISSLLSPQICDMISTLTSRPLIRLEAWSQIKCKDLKVINLQNPLLATAGGDDMAAETLFSKETLSWAKKKVSIKTENVRATSKRIIVAREEGLFRPMTNAKQIQKLCMSVYRFNRVFLEEASLWQIIEKFSNAEIVVAEYGAGLANILFMDKPGLVIEIRGPLERRAKEYQALVEALGHEHRLIVGRSRLISRHGLTRGPYAVSVKGLEKELLQVIE